MVGPTKYLTPYVVGFRIQDIPNREGYTEATKTGIEIGTLYPKNHPYYPSGWGESFKRIVTYGIALNPNSAPGRDIEITGYIITKNHKIPVGTVTVHVMYPE
jgi:hypothetical protein